MDMHPVSEYPDRAAADQRVTALRQMSADELLQLGARRLVYLRAGMRQGEMLIVLHGADGRPWATTDTVDDAVALAAQHGLSFVAVH